MALEDGWVVRLDPAGDGPLVAVKDAIDVAGLPTRVGSPALAAVAGPAGRDAACVAAVRAGGGLVAGKTATTELCWDESGVNDLVGTPVNPLDPTRVPGGSSSGSAVVVARGEADVALGTDTGGSVRIPAACCGVAALKTTWGRVSVDGVWPLAPTFDTVGPMARDVAGLVLGMSLLEHGFDAVRPDAPTVARLRPSVEVEPVVDAAVDAALAATGWKVVDVAVPWWGEVGPSCGPLLTAEAARVNAHLLDRRDLLSPAALDGIARGLRIDDGEMVRLREQVQRFRDAFLALLDGVDAVALPTLPRLPPRPDGDVRLVRLTFPANVAGLPALSLPVPTAPTEAGPGLPASLQLVGRPYEEERLLGLGLAVGSRPGG